VIRNGLTIKGNYSSEEYVKKVRSLGFGEEIAILDRHILRNLAALNVIDEVPKSMTIKKYYEIFPDDITGQNDITKSVLVEGNIHNRDIPVIKQMIKEGSILEEEAPCIMETIVRVHQSYLENILQQREKISLEEHKIKFFKIFDFLLKRNEK